jgi:hypothetical protein
MRDKNACLTDQIISRSGKKAYLPGMADKSCEMAPSGLTFSIGNLSPCNHRKMVQSLVGDGLSLASISPENRPEQVERGQSDKACLFNFISFFSG